MSRAKKVAVVIVAIVVVAALSGFLGLLSLYAHLYRETVTIWKVPTIITTILGATTTTVTTTAFGWRFWYEYSGHAVFPQTGPAHSGIDFSPRTLPQEFKVSTISKPSGNIEWGQPTVVHIYHYFGVQLDKDDKLPWAFLATAPIHFQMVFANVTPIGFPYGLAGLAYHPDQILNDTIQSVGFGELVAQAKGLYIFVFEPLETPNLTQSIAVTFSHYPIPVQWTTVTTTTSETVTVFLNQTVKIPMSPFDQPNVTDYPLRAAEGTLPTYIQIQLARGQAIVRLDR